jgi:hypothetical protein
MGHFLGTFSKMDFNRALAILAVVSFGVFAMIKIFSHMKDGFGPFNVRITGIVIVATLASILAVMNPSSESAAIGILGAIAGYLFGYGSKD